MGQCRELPDIRGRSWSARLNVGSALESRLVSRSEAWQHAYAMRALVSCGGGYARLTARCAAAVLRRCLPQERGGHRARARHCATSRRRSPGPRLTRGRPRSPAASPTSHRFDVAVCDDLPVTTDFTAPDWDELAGRMGVTAGTARRYLRGQITLPDGRQIIGQQPGTAGGQLEEHRLRDKLAEQIHGITEAVLPYGRADVLTAAAVFEVERHRTWQNGARQALAYSAQTGLPPALALFGTIHRDDLLKLYLKLRGDMWHGNAGAIALWWWTGYAWTDISSRTRCVNMPRGWQKTARERPPL